MLLGLDDIENEHGGLQIIQDGLQLARGPRQKKTLPVLLLPEVLQHTITANETLTFYMIFNCHGILHFTFKSIGCAS